jgi:hypothetical protein
MENRLGLIVLAADCGANDAEIAGLFEPTARP